MMNFIRITLIFGCCLPVILFSTHPLRTEEGVKSEVKPELKEVTFDTLKFDIKKGASFKRSLLTKEIEELHGTRIRLRGYMLPQFQQKGITQFVLVRDNLECCFGPGAALYDCMIVEMEAGLSTTFTVRPIAVEGVFKIDEFKDPDGNPLAIFHLDGLKVK